MSKRLWLTYAWKDNAESDVDFGIQRLRAEGLEVKFDRAELAAGRRLWEQLDRAISTGCDGWAMYITKASLESQPCQEEIAYALDRALREGPEGFPLIGIFPQKLDRSIVPSALATRLHVYLSDPTWAEAVAAGMEGIAARAPSKTLDPYVLTPHQHGGKLVLEIRPRTGVWRPFVAATLDTDPARVLRIWDAPRGRPHQYPTMLATLSIDAEVDQGKLAGMGIDATIDASISAFVEMSAKPRLLVFGDPHGERYTVATNAGAIVRAPMSYIK